MQQVIKDISVHLPCTIFTLGKDDIFALTVQGHDVDFFFPVPPPPQLVEPNVARKCQPPKLIAANGFINMRHMIVNEMGFDYPIRR